MSQQELRGLWAEVEQARESVAKHRAAALGSGDELDLDSVALYQQALLRENNALKRYAEARRTVKLAS